MIKDMPPYLSLPRRQLDIPPLI